MSEINPFLISGNLEYKNKGNLKIVDEFEAIDSKPGPMGMYPSSMASDIFDTLEEMPKKDISSIFTGLQREVVEYMEAYQPLTHFLLSSNLSKLTIKVMDSIRFAQQVIKRQLSQEELTELLKEK